MTITFETLKDQRAGLVRRVTVTETLEQHRRDGKHSHHSITLKRKDLALLIVELRDQIEWVDGDIRLIDFPLVPGSPK